MNKGINFLSVHAYAHWVDVRRRRNKALQRGAEIELLRARHIVGELEAQYKPPLAPPFDLITATFETR